VEELFKGRHFDRGIVILCVRWYLRYKMSLRDLVEMMAERGLSMAHTWLTDCSSVTSTKPEI
jgi:transposase-like protein